MKRNLILIGLGILVILLALAGTGSAHNVYGNIGAQCSFCHSSTFFPLTASGIFFEENHKLDGLTEPLTSATSCTKCHTNVNTVFLPLTQAGQNYSNSHRYNDTTLAAARLPQPACYNCHVDVVLNNFNRLTDTPTYLKSDFCENCHKRKYDDWQGTMHRVMLTKNSTAQAMGLPTPMGFSWENMPFVIVGKQELRYLNESGYLFKRYFANGTSADYGPSQYTCGRCHTTGYNANGGNQSGLPGIVGTWVEPGIACEKCHGPGGNGHQVEANVSEQVCLQCHNGSTRQGTFLSSAHSPPLKAPVSCLRCHSPFDYARNRTVTSSTAINVVCANCHNSHNTSDNKYREIFSPGGFDQTAYADVKDAKNSLFNSTASKLLLTGGPTGTLTAGKDVYDILTTPALIPSDIIDESYPGPINVTGPISEVLCSNCHYEHGLSHIAGVNLTHARLNYPGLGLAPATCTDCHMSGDLKSHSFNVKDENNFPSRTCSRGTECHVTSDQNLNHSRFSVVPVVNEWKKSLHNDKVNGGFYNRTGGPRERESSCSKCHSPSNWNPVNERAIVSADAFNGITCAICHNIHDMGDWLKKTGKAYAWYDRNAIPVLNSTGAITRYKANYSMMANTTELCGNCHSNDNPRIYRAGPGWNQTTDTTPISPHGWPAKDFFVGSVKQTVFNFECISCHMATKVTDPTNLTEIVLPDSQKVTGHSFKVNVPLLQSNATCAGCHITGTELGNISATIDKIKADTHTKWDATNITVMNALKTINESTGQKDLSRDLIAQAYWNLRMVSSDESWGVHNPIRTSELLDNATALANKAVESLGQIDDITPVINTVNMNTNSPTTGQAILVSVNATDNIAVTSVKANGVPLTFQVENLWNGTIIAIEGTNPVNVSASDAAGNTAWDNSTSYTATTTGDNTLPVIVDVALDNTTPTTGQTILVSVNATDNIAVTSVKANGVSLTFQVENLWNGTITAIEGTNPVNVSASDAAGNTAWDNSTSYTATTTGDNTLPVIVDVALDNTIPTTGQAILVSVNATDNIAVTSVKANGVPLTFQVENLWTGTIIAIEGTNPVNVSAGDAAGNTAWDNSTSYTATTTPSINLIGNPGFESGTSPWRFYTNGVGSFRVVSPGFERNNAARLILNTNGTNIQLYQKGILLEPNTTYRLSFAAYSSSGRDLRVNLFKHSFPYTNYGLYYRANLGKSWQTFSTEFTTKGFRGTVNDARLMFYLAPFVVAGDVYFIDDVRLEKI